MSRRKTQPDTEVDARRELVAMYYLKQHRQSEIVTLLVSQGLKEVTQQTISNDLKAIREAWRKSAIMDMNEAKQKELARIDALEREYWLQYEESKKPRQIASERISTNKHETMKRAEQRTGDTRYLSGIQWCIEQRCKILGLNAPVQVEVSWEQRAILDIRAGVIVYHDLAQAFDESLATRLFTAAGVSIPIRED